MKKLFVLLSVVFMVMLTACGGTSDVSTGGEGNSVEKKEEPMETTEQEVSETEEVIEEELEEESSKIIDTTSQTTEVLGLKVGLGEIKLTETQISVGVNMENTIENTLTFYPDQGTIVVGDMQLEANLFMSSGDLGGDIFGGVKKDGVVEFSVPEGKKLDINAVTEIKLMFGEVITDDFMNSEPVNFTVPVQ